MIVNYVQKNQDTVDFLRINNELDGVSCKKRSQKRSKHDFHRGKVNILKLRRTNDANFLQNYFFQQEFSERDKLGMIIPLY